MRNAEVTRQKWKAVTRSSTHQGRHTWRTQREEREEKEGGTTRATKRDASCAKERKVEVRMGHKVRWRASAEFRTRACRRYAARRRPDKAAEGREEKERRRAMQQAGSRNRVQWMGEEQQIGKAAKWEHRRTWQEARSKAPEMIIHRGVHRRWRRGDRGETRRGVRMTKCSDENRAHNARTDMSSTGEARGR